METDQEPKKVQAEEKEDDYSEVFEDKTAKEPVPDLDIGGAHTTVKAARRAASSRRQLNPSPSVVECASFSTSFTSGGDERILRCHISHNLKERTSTSHSFDTRKKNCTSCVSGAHAALAGGSGQPIVCVAADQSFPACVPATDTNECIRVVRVEDGSLQEVIHALADAVGTSKIGIGTVIALGSISHLAEVGTAQYITDWVRSRIWLKSRLGEHIAVIPLIPILSNGWDGRSTVRSLIEVLHWFMSLGDTEAVLMKGIMHQYIETNLARIPGRGWADGRQCFKVPAGLDTKAFVSVVSEGWGCRPDGIPPMSLAAEQEMILSLITMLNEAFNTQLCTAPLLYRKGTDWKAAVSTKAMEMLVAVIGGSNATRIAERLEREERQVFRLTTPGWRITKGGVQNMVDTIASLDPKPDCLIIQALDNSAYYCLHEDGTLSLPTRSYTDGKFHVEGELMVASEDQTKALLKLLLPLLKAVPGAQVILVTCLPRYTNSPCCANTAHSVGRVPDFKEKIMADLVQMKKHVRAFALKENLTQLRIVDPVQLLDGIDLDDHQDPVHPPEALYEKLATKLTDIMEGSGQSAAKEPESKRIRLVSYGVARGGMSGWAAPRGGRGGGRGAQRGGQRGRGRRSF